MKESEREHLRGSYIINSYVAALRVTRPRASRSKLVVGRRKCQSLSINFYDLILSIDQDGKDRGDIISRHENGPSNYASTEEVHFL